ncbi:WD40 repeat-like protein [Sistotremastrum niveocremeum HHB9708]|uniref:WD40 repeat-like protein n=2 Tax=Sistotremastraceae TaxID=3402574 RepID=A0A164PA31_9AGAM|nr:WD40 repeat-like protein [Sistotremastrum niveocremeum HHB9708]KZT34117.1 WD40 repeat-like protein [Sistotremastrum suecicum HHB10207 ss-3]
MAETGSHAKNAVNRRSTGSDFTTQVALEVFGMCGANFPPTLDFVKRNKRFFLELEYDGQSWRSSLSERETSPVWLESCIFNIDKPLKILKIKAFVKHMISDDVLLGDVEENLWELESQLSADDFTEYHRSLTNATSPSQGPTISFKIRLTSPTTIAKSSLDFAHLQVESLQKPPGTLRRISGVFSKSHVNAFHTVEPLANDIKSFLSRIEGFVKLVHRVSEVHPYAKLAVDVFTLAYTILSEQQQRDRALSNLVQVMDSTYEFILHARPLFEEESQRKLGDRLVQQTLECGYFIQACAQEKNFFKRALSNIASALDAKIMEYEVGFAVLLQAFQQSAVVHTEIVVLQSVRIIENISLDVNLNDMQYVGEASFVPEKGCLDGTRTELLDVISQWIMRPVNSAGASLFWLTGFPGSGKSALAHSIAERFFVRKRLGSCFVFEQSTATKRRAEAVFSNISRDLTGLIPEWKESVGRIIQEVPDLRHTPSVRRQFEELIVRPAKEMTLVGPILIVLDALDECGGDTAAVKELRYILSSRLDELPSNFRFFLTSRPHIDLENAFKGRTHVARHDLRCIAKDSIDHDLELYYRERLHGIPLLERHWPNEGWIPILVQNSEGLFQWAFTACEFILERGRNHIQRLETLLQKPDFKSSDSLNASAGLKVLNALYSSILHNIFAFDDNDDRLPGFRSVLGRTLCVRTPLHMTDIASLRGPEESEETTESILKWMGSVLTGVSPESPGRVQSFHTSFRDFVFSKERSGIYYIDPNLREEALARSCLTIMNTGLQFNVCELDTSYTFGDPQSVHPRLHDRVSPSLFYAANLWSSHLVETEFHPELAALLHTFTETCQFLYWLELLGLAGNIFVAGGVMKSVTAWVKDNDGSLAAFGEDAENFINNFADVIARSPSHLYISALPFSPETSLVSSRFSPHFDGTIKVSRGKPKAWNALERVFGERGDAETKRVVSMAFSPDGVNLVAITEDGLVRLWNPATGLCSSSLTESGTFHSTVAAVSPNGCFFVLGSKPTSSSVQIVFRDFKTLAVVWEPITVSASDILCLRFSPDGTMLWVGDALGRIGAWNTKDGTNIVPMQKLCDDSQSTTALCTAISFDTTYSACAFHRHESITLDIFKRDGSGSPWSPIHRFKQTVDPIRALEFSPDGRRVVCGHESGVLEMWSVETGECVTKSLVRHNAAVASAAFSPDGKLLLSSSADHTVRLWDGESGSPIGKPLTGLGDSPAMVFCPSGDQIVTGSSNGVLCLWDRATVVQFNSREQEDRSSLTDLAISPDGRHMFTSTSDASIRNYQITASPTGDQARLMSQLHGHSGKINRMAISPDGRILVSCSQDATICVWDAETGASVREPLTGHTEEILCVAFRADGERLLSGGRDQVLHIWDTKSWERTQVTLTGHCDAVTSAQYFPDGNRIISGSRNEVIFIWDAENGRIVGKPIRFHTASISEIAISPTEDLVASSSYNGEIILWNPKTLDRHQNLWHGGGMVRSLVFSKDGRSLLSTSTGRTTCLWNTETGALVTKPWEGHASGVTRARFFDDETRVISSSNDGVIRIWDKAQDETSPASELQILFPRISYDGWIQSDDEDPKLLFWLPPLYWPNFVWNRCRTLIGAEPLMLDFDRFEHGKRWTHCRTRS